MTEAVIITNEELAILCDIVWRMERETARESGCG